MDVTDSKHHLQLTCQICMQAWRKHVDLTVCTVGLLRTGSPALHSSSVIPDNFAQTCKIRASKGAPGCIQDYAEGREMTATEQTAQCAAKMNMHVKDKTLWCPPKRLYRVKHSLQRLELKRSVLI